MNPFFTLSQSLTLNVGVPLTEWLRTIARTIRDAFAGPELSPREQAIRAITGSCSCAGQCNTCQARLRDLIGDNL